MPENPPDIYSALLPIFIISRVLGLIPLTYNSKTSSKSTLRSSLRTLYNGFMFLLVLGWFISSIIFDSLHHYTRHTGMYIIPMFSKMCTIFGATLAALIICHRGILQHVCKKLTLIDKILLVPPDAYKRSRLVLAVEIMVVFSASGVIHVFDMQDRQLDYITTMEGFGWILVSYINCTVILQFLTCVRIIRNRFEKLNAQLSAMIVHEFEEEELHTLLSNSYFLSRRLSQSTEEGCLGRGSRITSGTLSISTVCNRTRGRVFVYDPLKIHTLRLTHSMLYKLTRAINSDFSIQILLEMLHSFISLTMSMYVGMTGRSNPHGTNCGEDANCVRVVTHFSFAAFCIAKFVAITAFCHMASDEMSRTPALVQKLLLPRPLGADSFNELQLFYKQIRNITTEFTAFGFFTLNLKLLSSIAAAATTYIVILIQSRPMEAG
jgi:hypothetical protein